MRGVRVLVRLARRATSRRGRLRGVRLGCLKPIGGARDDESASPGRAARRRLGHVTDASMSDKAASALDSATDKGGAAASTVKDAAASTAKAADKVADATKDTAAKVADATKDTAAKVADATATTVKAADTPAPPRTADEIESDLDAVRTRLAGRIDDLEEYVSPKNIADREVQRVKGIFVDEYGGIKPDRVLVVVGIVAAVFGIGILRRRRRS